jgi:hypothetical protein
MSSILRRAIALVALAIGIGVAAGTAPAAAATTHTIKSSATHVVAHPHHLANGGAKSTEDWWF